MRGILKQTSWLMFAQILTRVISFFYTLFLAKNLGVSDFGLLTAALAYFSIISSLVDFGFNRYLIREVARNNHQVYELFWNILLSRLTITAVLFANFAIIIYILDPNKLRVSLILLATLAILPQAVGITIDGVFVGFRKLQFSAISIFLASLTSAILGYFLVIKGYGAYGAVDGLIISQIIYVIVLGILLYKTYGVSKSKVSVLIIKKIMVGSLPYGLLGVLGLLYFRIDAIILSYIRGSFETGIYGISYRFLDAITVIPSAFFLAIFPIFSNIHDTDLKLVKKFYFKSLIILGSLGTLLLIVYIVILPHVINIFIPSYLPSIESIKILSISIPFMFLQAPTVSVLLSTDKYLKQVLVLSIFTLGFNVIANLIFIPINGYIAASWITVISELLSFVIFFVFINYQIFKKAV